MKPVGALSSSIDTLRRTPIVFGILFAFSLLSTVASAVQIINPLLVYVGLGVIYLFVPFLLGGLIAYIGDSLTGTPSFDRFVAAGKANYIRLLVGGLLLGVVTFVLYFVVAFASIILAAVVLGVSGLSGIGAAALVPIALVSLVGFLVVLLPWFFSQFFPAAVVLDGDGVADSFRRSFGLVRSQFLSVIGFDLLAFAISFVAQLPTFYLFYDVLSGQTFQNQTQTSTTIFELFSTTQLVVFFGSSLLVGTIVGSVLYTYYVAYYDEIAGSVDTSSAEPDTVADPSV